MSNKKSNKRKKRLKTFKIEKSDEKILGNGGLALIGSILSDLNLDERLNHINAGYKTEPKISNADVVISYLALLTNGKCNFSEIELFRKDEAFKELLGIENIPSEGILRQRLNNLMKYFLF